MLDSSVAFDCSFHSNIVPTSASSTWWPPSDLLPLQGSDSGLCSSRVHQWASTAGAAASSAPLLDLSDPFTASASLGSAPHLRPLSSSIFSTSATPNGELESAMFASMTPPTALTSYPLLWPQQQQQQHYQPSLATQPEQMLHSTPIALQSSCAAQFTSGTYMHFRSKFTPPPPLPSPPVACLTAPQTGRSANPLSMQSLRPVLQPLANRHSVRAAAVEEVPPNHVVGPSSSYSGTSQRHHIPVQKTRGRTRTAPTAPAKRARRASDLSDDSNESRLRTTFSKRTVAVLNDWCV